MARLTYGVNRVLEDEADRLIKESLQGVTKYSEKADILTPWKEKNRQSREILTPTGFPEAHSRQGMYHRSANTRRPDLNSKDGLSRASNRGLGWSNTYQTEYGREPE